MHRFKVIVSIVLVDKNGKFFLAKRSDQEEVFPGFWSIPGGRVDSGPAMFDVLETNLKREVKEEIGVEIAIDRYLESHSDGKEKIYVIFQGHIIKGKPICLEDTQELNWFDFNKIKKLKLTPRTLELIEKIAKNSNTFNY